MTFKGQAPLVSPSELTFFPDGSSFPFTVAGGLLTASSSGGAVWTVNASGPETDNVYVGFSVEAPTGGFSELIVGFGLDDTHYMCASPAGSGGTYSAFDVFVNNGGVTGSFGGSVSPPIPYDTTTNFLTFYLAISGTLASVYSINQNTGLTALLGTVDVSSIVSAATLQTWSAAMRVQGNGTVLIKNVVWGPVSDLAPITVPPVVGLMLSPAETIITAAALEVGIITSLPNIAPTGTVTAQDPVAGAVVLFNTPVNLTVSSGQPPTTVPQLINTSLAPVAATLLADADLIFGSVTYLPSVLVISGNIISQNPAAGTVVNSGSAVDVVVSTGRAGVFVPFIVEDDQTEAMTDITSIGLVVGAISVRESLTIPAGEVIAQNPQGGTPVASGSIVSFTLSSGPPVPGPAFDWTTTVISQYANSPSLLLLCQSIADNLDQTVNFANFYAFVWNVDTAQGFGLDVWGKIVNVSRFLQIPTGALYVGFQDGSSGSPDPNPGGPYDVQPFNASGTFFTPQSATQTYELEDEPYRQLILAKALANISRSTVPTFNQILQRLFPGRGNPYVVNDGAMNFQYVFDFELTPIELAILNQSGVMPVPPGVSFTIVVP